ncbi:hypothetical protein [Alloscardovia omnicolens]
MVNLIDSHTGTMNVTAREVGYVETGLTGTGTFLLKLDDKFPTVNTVGNNVIIPMSFWLVDGRRFSIMNAETITSDIGQNGYNRIDLICLHYKCDKSTGVESVELVCVKGIRTTGIAEAPSVKQLDLNTLPAESYKPLLRLNWSGTTLQCVLADGVKQLPSTSMMMDSFDTKLTSVENNLRNVESRVTSLQATKSTTVRLPYQTGGAYTLTREGNIVTLGGQGTCDNVQNAGNLKVNEAIPAGYRPTAPMSVSWGGNQKMDMLVKPDGTITLLGNAYGWVHIGASWITHDLMPD